MLEVLAMAELADDLRVIDADTHFTEPRDLWTSRAPAKYRDRVLTVRKTARGQENWYIEDQYVSSIGPGIVAADESKALGTITLPTLEEMSPAQTEPSARLKV